MQQTPNANRLHIAIFGRRNAGKSSLINAITGQEIALVSQFAGTTADPVYKAMELLPIGPVVIIDTAGIDDVGELGNLRVAKTKEVISKTDVALLVFAADQFDHPDLAAGPYEAGSSTPDLSAPDLSAELEWFSMLQKSGVTVIGVLNKVDGPLAKTNGLLELLQERFPVPFVMTSIYKPDTINSLKRLLADNVPYFEKDTIVGDLFAPGDVVLLVAPQDIQAPKGRLILPQVQIMRDVLDHKGLLMTVTADQLPAMLDHLKSMPDLVITDSQVFERVHNILPENVPLTSFSILMARYKGDLSIFTEGAKAISTLQDNDKVLIAEACTHHALQGDIGREKLPKWLREFTGKKLDIITKAGVDFADDLTEFSLVVHCGACMFNRKQMMSRILRSKNQNVPITNYGTAIAYMNGILGKVTECL